MEIPAHLGCAGMEIPAHLECAGMEIPTHLRCPRWSVEQESLQLAGMFQPLFHAGYSYSTLTLGGQNLEENFNSTFAKSGWVAWGVQVWKFLHTSGVQVWKFLHTSDCYGENHIESA